MADEQTQTADWKCNTCGATEDVRSGFCKECGATQTTPLTKKAQIEAGIPQEEDLEKEEADEEQQQTEE
jgi:predicted ATP-dependent serine protease